MEKATCAKCGTDFTRPRGRKPKSGYRCKECRKVSGKHASCVYCEEATGGKRFCSIFCQGSHAWERRSAPIVICTCRACGGYFAELASTAHLPYCSGECRTEHQRNLWRANHKRRMDSDPAYRARVTARNRHNGHRRRTAKRSTDVTTAHINDLLRARKCATCDCYLTTAPGPRQKQVDHIIPLASGGTHTVGNLRVICRTCNLTRPNDGSDLDGHQPTLWAGGASGSLASSPSGHPGSFRFPPRAQKV